LLKNFPTLTRADALRLAQNVPHLVRAPGFEPGTYRVSVDCSSQLSYARICLNKLNLFNLLWTNASRRHVLLPGKTVEAGSWKFCFGENKIIPDHNTVHNSITIPENSIFYKEKGPTHIAPARLRTHFRRCSSPSLRIYRPLHVRPRGNSPRTGTLAAILPPALARRCGQVVAEEDESERCAQRVERAVEELPGELFTIDGSLFCCTVSHDCHDYGDEKGQDCETANGFHVIS
jgi:hypothetical protein